MSKAQRRALDAQLRQAKKPASSSSIEEMRMGFAWFMTSFPVPGDVRRTPSELGDRPAILVEPTKEIRPGTILYFHGGSFSLGSPETAMTLTANLVSRTGIRAISLDYRLAPEHPFPAAINDCVEAYRALLESGLSPEAIAFAGDSAGGGLAVTTCLGARAAGLPMPAAIVAFSPGLDHTRTGNSMTTKVSADPFFSEEAMARTGELYLAGQDPHTPLLAPAVYADLTGFPPILLQVGTNEMLLDDSVRLANLARDAGVDVILDVTADVPHVFQAFGEAIEEAGQALDRVSLFLSQRLAN